MTTQTEAERLADALDVFATWRDDSTNTLTKSAAELRRLVSFNQQLMDEVARLNKAVADEREACAKVCDTTWDGDADTHDYAEACNECAAAIRARGNT